MEYVLLEEGCTRENVHHTKKELNTEYVLDGGGGFRTDYHHSFEPNKEYELEKKLETPANTFIIFE